MKDIMTVTNLFLHRAHGFPFQSCHVLSAADAKYHSSGNQQAISSPGTALIGVRDAGGENVKLNRQLEREEADHNNLQAFSLQLQYSMFSLPQEDILEWLLGDMFRCPVCLDGQTLISLGLHLCSMLV